MRLNHHQKRREMPGVFLYVCDDHWLAPMFRHLGGESRLAQFSYDVRSVLGIARFQHKFHVGRLHRQIGESMLTMHFFDIGIGLGNDTGNARQRARQERQTGKQSDSQLSPGHFDAPPLPTWRPPSPPRGEGMRSFRRYQCWLRIWPAAPAATSPLIPCQASRRCPCDVSPIR